MPRALGHGLESPGKAGRPRRPSDQVPSLPGQLVDTSGPREKAQVSRDSWSTPRGLGYSPELPGRAGRPNGPSGKGPSLAGCLVDTAVRPTRARVARDSCSTTWALGPRPESPGTAGQNPRALGPRPESCKTAGRPRGSLGTVPSLPGQLVDPASPRTRARVSRERSSTPGALGPKREAPRTAVQHPGPRA